MKFNIILESIDEGYLLSIPVLDDSALIVESEEVGIKKANELISEYIESLIEMKQLKPDQALNGKSPVVIARKVLYTVSI